MERRFERRRAKRCTERGAHSGDYRKAHYEDFGSRTNAVPVIGEELEFASSTKRRRLCHAVAASLSS